MQQWLNQMRLKIKALFQREELDRELEDELAFHLTKRAEKNRDLGADSDEARHAARRQFGNLSGVKEQSHDIWTFVSLESVWQDIRFSGRLFWKSPGFTIIAVLTLTLGIGANTAIFSMVDWLILRSLPISQPQQMTFLAYARSPAEFYTNFSYSEFAEIRKQTGDTFADAAATIENGGDDGLTVDGETQPAVCAFVTGNFFPLLGIKPHLGRFILPAEGSTPGTDPVVVLSYRYWKSRFGGDPGIVGSKAAFNGHPVTIVGVGPADFVGLTPIVETQAYLPLGMATVAGFQPTLFTNPKDANLTIFARLRPGTNMAQIQPRLALLGQNILKASRSDQHGSLVLKPLRPPGIITGPDFISKLAALFLTLAALVLLIACVNVANLLLVRASTRQREMAVRAALGAPRSRLLRQLLTESFLLSLLGCMGGILAGLYLTRTLSALRFQTESPIVLDFQFDWRVFAYALGVATVTGIFVGAVPALRASRGNLRQILHEGGRTSTGGRQRLRGILVAAQVGGSLALLIIAGLFVRSLGSVQRADLGFDPQNVLNFSMNPREIGYTDTQGLAFYKELLDHIRGLPGAQSAGITSAVPLGEYVSGADLEIAGVRTNEGEQPPHALFSATTPGTLQTMRMHLLQGRDFNERDDENSPGVALINEAMAKKFWPNQDPLGKQFSRVGDSKHRFEIVGVVNNARNVQLYGPFEEYFYVPFALNYSPTATLQLRSTASPQAMIPAVLGLVQSLAPTMPVFGVRTMTEALHGFNGLLLFEMGAVLAGALGLLGLTLAIIGVYGVMSYSVSQRTQEIGVRMAFGAQPHEVLAMIARQGGFIVAVGIAVGALAAFGASSLVQDFLVGVTARDPATYLTVSVVLASVAIIAAYVPARRATRVDPMVALRYE